MTGLTAAYDFTPKQQLVLQVLNSNGKPATAFYGENIVESRLPLVYSIGWNASMCNDLWQTRWSVSAMNEISDKYMYYVALGNQFNFSSKWNMYIDFMGDKGGIRLQYGGNFTVYGTKDGKLWQETPEYASVNMFQNEIDSFIRCIKTGEKLPSHIDQVIITARMMQAIYDSSDAREEIKLEW